VVLGEIPGSARTSHSSQSSQSLAKCGAGGRAGGAFLVGGCAKAIQPLAVSLVRNGDVGIYWENFLPSLARAE